MGLIKDAIGSALGANDVKNGFGGPRMSFGGTQNRNQQYRGSRNDGASLSPSLSLQNSRLQPQVSPGGYSPSNRRYRQSPSRDPFYQQQQSASYSVPGGFEHSKKEYASTSHLEPPSYEFTTRDPQYADESYRQRSFDQRRSNEHLNHEGIQRDRSNQNGFRPIALPQITYGDGQPFLRGYSCELEQYGISRTTFIGIIDAVNKAIVPNPEMQIFQKGANIAGWFIPGAASIGLMAGQVVVGVGGAFGHAAMINKVLAKANLDHFVPHGLEICIGKTSHLDQELGARQNRQQSQYQATPEDRIADYGRLLAPLDEILPDAQKVGRRDPIALYAKASDDKANQKKAQKAQKDLMQGKAGKMDKMEEDVKWLIVRRASEKATNEWQMVLQQSEASLQSEQNRGSEQDGQRMQ